MNDRSRLSSALPVTVAFGLRTRPQASSSGLGAFLAVLAAIAAAIVRFLWFPVTKLIGKLCGELAGPETEAGRGRGEASP